MAKPKRNTNVTPPPPKLVIPKEEVKARLKERIEKGRRLQENEITSPEALSEARGELGRWNEYNYELLRQLFDTETFYREYRWVYVMGWGDIIDEGRTLQDKANNFKKSS